MAGKWKKRTAQFKAQVALATVKWDKTTNELASQRAVHPTLINAWKKLLLQGAYARLLPFFQGLMALKIWEN